MTAIARLEILPIREERMSDQIAAAIDALEEFDVSYLKQRESPAVYGVLRTLRVLMGIANLRFAQRA